MFSELDFQDSDAAFKVAIKDGRLTCGCGCLGFKTDRQDPLDACDWMYMGGGTFKHGYTRMYLHQYELEAKAQNKSVAEVVAADIRDLTVR